ncbi:hypothetical protein AGMMS49944_26880 [Spirochaetia bacterium]|nr:hypothetical protein AGMMS49944_26880 [Spirochaetia bacterium]
MDIENAKKLLKEEGYEILNEYTSKSKSLITTRTADEVFNDIAYGFNQLSNSIIKYADYVDGSEALGITRKRESVEGDAFKKGITDAKNFVQARISEIRPIATTIFDTTVSKRRTALINNYSNQIKIIKDAFNESSIMAEGVVVPPESHEVYRACFSYINLIPKLNKIIKKHNDHFAKLVPPRKDQIIDEVEYDF